MQPEDIHQENVTETEASNPSVEDNTEDNTLIQEDHEELPQSETEITEKEQPVPVHTSRVAQMVTGVSEIAPEPHTGAISKVFVPGEDARVIRQDTDMDMLRDITEESVQEEHDKSGRKTARMYLTSSLLYRKRLLLFLFLKKVADAVQEEEQDTQEEVFHPMTGQMNLDEVLGEWERMKQENAAKHKEEVRKLVLQQTGKIFENFDNSVKNGIFGELEKEDEDEGEVEELTEIEDTPDMEETELQEKITESQGWMDEEKRDRICRIIRCRRIHGRVCKRVV